ncbi:hypothetical protein ALC56_05151 [Trachymyrmex septentrionalis]|uniref:Uncharacterized protein n=1 Tax=Trachymyrmex septentrionalis TaxID=34720 RepID=A0A195FIW6_9HYME|nr:hypothetical protein ALC56_05151 [Trachymyrmex septentrionalis]
MARTRLALESGVANETSRRGKERLPVPSARGKDSSIEVCETSGKFEGQVLPGPISGAIMHPARQITIGKYDESYSEYLAIALEDYNVTPKGCNLEHFTRDTRSLPVGPVHVMRGRDAIYSQGCGARLLDIKHDRATHDWGSLTDHLEMNNGWHETPEASSYVKHNKSRPFLFLANVLACSIPSGEGFTAFRERYRRRCESARKLGVRYAGGTQKGRKKEDSRRNKEGLPRTALREASSEKERRLKSLPTR